ncbi:MAG: sensor histidine kinase [Waterburya sp.]
MNRLKQLRTYPFGLLLCLEWILLSLAILGELPDSFLWGQNDQASASVFLSSILSFLCLLSLGLIGLKLPTQKTSNKWLYVILQLGLILLPTTTNQQILPLLTPCLIVTMRNCLIFKSKERWLANILVFICIIPSLTYITSFAEFQDILSQYQAVSFAEFQIRRNISNISYLFVNGLSITFICILVNALLKEYQSQQQLAIAREQLRQYAIQAEDRAAVNERNRIAREIHDSVGHALTAQTIQLNNAIAFWQSQPDKAYQFLTEAKELVTTALKEIRYSINTLRSDPLEGKSLEDAIALLFQEFSSRTKIIPDNIMVLNHSLSEEIKLTVYRIIQEALTNIVKHSQAEVVKVELQTFSEHLSLLMEDNGKGFNPEQNTTGFGLQGMRERVMALKGKMEISSSLQRGCTIIITIPFNKVTEKILINQK